MLNEHFSNRPPQVLALREAQHLAYNLKRTLTLHFFLNAVEMVCREKWQGSPNAPPGSTKAGLGRQKQPLYTGRRESSAGTLCPWVFTGPAGAAPVALVHRLQRSRLFHHLG